MLFSQRSYHLKSWKFFLHDLHRTDCHVQLVNEVLCEVAELEVAVGGPGALGRVVTLHLHHHLEQGGLSSTIFSNCKDSCMIESLVKLAPMHILDSIVAERSTFEKITRSVPG